MKLSRSFVNLTLVLSIAIMLFATLPVSSALAYSDGPRDPGTGTSDSGVGSEPWVDANEITTPGSAYASVNLYHLHRVSNYLQGTQYGFNIPAEIEILGIEVVVNRYSPVPNSQISDYEVRLLKEGVPDGDNKASTLSWPTSMTAVTYGSPTDMWGTTWTAEDVNSDDFGAALSAQRDNNGNNDRYAIVDTLQVTVYYAYASSMEVDCGGGTPETAYGDGVTCVATVTRAAGDQTPTGTVDWTTDGSGLFETNPCTLAGSDGVASCSVTYTPDAVGTGSHLVNAVYSGDDFFATSSNGQSVAVFPRPVTATADPQTKTYGELDPVYTYQVTQGSLVFNDTFTGTLTRDPGENAGQYAIMQGSLELPVDYDLSYVGDYLTITPADAVCEVTPYSVTYDGEPHTADGTCTGVMGEPLEGLDLSGSTHTDAGTYTDPWSFTDVTGNYHVASGTVEDYIGQADAVCEVAGYDVIYDGEPHTATGTCTGVMGEPLNGLDLSGSTHTDSGTYTDPWSFTDVTGNYHDASGMVEDYIGQADATCVVTGYNVTFDGNNHTATGECVGVMGEALDGLDLVGTVHAVPGSYTDVWIFSDANGNYAYMSGLVDDFIAKADPGCEVMPYLLEYDRQAHTATGACLGVDGNPLAELDLTGTTHTEIGTYLNDPWTYTDVTGNYNDDNGTANNLIIPRTILVVADDRTKVYGQPDPELTYQVTIGSLLSGDTFSGELSRQPGENIGTYAILKGTLALPDYYNIVYRGANLTINGYRYLYPIMFRSNP